jgi:TonB family protein
MKICYSIVSVGVLLIVTAGALSSQKEDGGLGDDARLVSFADLEYPGLARVARIQGIVVVEAQLDDKGNVASASAISGAKSLIPDCLSNVKKWKFKPNSRKNIIIVYEFRLDEGACHDASHSLFRLRYENFASITACAPVVGG